MSLLLSPGATKQKSRFLTSVLPVLGESSDGILCLRTALRWFFMECIENGVVATS